MENEKIHRKGALQTCLFSCKGLGLRLKAIKLKMQTWFNQNSFSDYQSKLKLKSARTFWIEAQKFKICSKLFGAWLLAARFVKRFFLSPRRLVAVSAALYETQRFSGVLKKISCLMTKNMKWRLSRRAESDLQFPGFHFQRLLRKFFCKKYLAPKSCS